MKKIADFSSELYRKFIGIPYRRRTLALFLFLNLSLVAVSIVYALHVSHSLDEGVDAVTCNLKEVLGFYCPGCGGSRSLYYMLTLQPIKSLIAYPPLIPSAMILGYVDVVVLVSIIRNDPSILKRIKASVLIIIPVMIFANFIIRNILLFGFHIDPLGDILPK